MNPSLSLQFPTPQEALGLAFEGMGLLDEALAQYDELDAVLAQPLPSIERLKWFPESLVANLPVPLLARTRATVVPLLKNKTIAGMCVCVCPCILCPASV